MNLLKIAFILFGSFVSASLHADSCPVLSGVYSSCGTQFGLGVSGTDTTLSMTVTQSDLSSGTTDYKINTVESEATRSIEMRADGIQVAQTIQNQTPDGPVPAPTTPGTQVTPVTQVAPITNVERVYCEDGKLKSDRETYVANLPSTASYLEFSMQSDGTLLMQSFIGVPDQTRPAEAAVTIVCKK
jgi:hypothetical protein